MRYKANKGGHAPGHIREEFIEFIESLESDQKNSIQNSDHIQWLLGQLWNCTDILPADDCLLLDMPRGSTYGMAAKKLKAELKRENRTRH